MKKTILLSLAMVSSMAAFSQTVLWDGENQEIGSKGGLWDDGAPTVVENPSKNGVNISGKCLKFTMTNGSKVVKVPFRDWITPDLKGNRRFSLMIKKPVNCNVNIEISDPTDGSNGYWEKVAAWYGGSGEWQKVVFDFSTNTAINDHPGVMAITASTDDVSGSEDVYIDNIVIEDMPMVNGTPLSQIADNSLSGKLTLTGSWMQGDCQNADGDWQRVEYNDFATLAAKCTASVTSIDMRGTVLKDAYNPVGEINPNIIIYADNAFNENNVVADGKIANLNLNEGYAFNAPEAFTADKVTVSRNVAQGYNSFCLPFSVTSQEIGANNIGTYTGESTSDETTTVNFANVSEVDANTPFIANIATAAEQLTFDNKEITATPESLGTALVGVYTPQSGEGLWGIGNNEFIKGGEGSTFNTFHAYLNEPSSAKKVVFDMSTTGINGIVNSSAKAVDVYNVYGQKVKTGVKADNALQGLHSGIYVVVGKKYVVK